MCIDGVYVRNFVVFRMSFRCRYGFHGAGLGLDGKQRKHTHTIYNVKGKLSEQGGWGWLCVHHLGNINARGRNERRAICGTCLEIDSFYALCVCTEFCVAFYILTAMGFLRTCVILQWRLV